MLHNKICYIFLKYHVRVARALPLVNYNSPNNRPSSHNVNPSTTIFFLLTSPPATAITVGLPVRPTMASCAPCVWPRPPTSAGPEGGGQEVRLPWTPGWQGPHPLHYTYTYECKSTEKTERSKETQRERGDAADALQNRNRRPLRYPQMADPSFSLSNF
jgi:hypothetical protein